MNILVVDDEIFICDLLDEFLTRLGHSVTTALSGHDALIELSKNKYGLVLMDIKMPGMTGRELLRKIREIDGSTRVIVLSAFGDGVTVNDMLQMGADDFLVKPFELLELEELVSNPQKGIDERSGCEMS